MTKHPQIGNDIQFTQIGENVNCYILLPVAPFKLSPIILHFDPVDPLSCTRFELTTRFSVHYLQNTISRSGIMYAGWCISYPKVHSARLPPTGSSASDVQPNFYDTGFLEEELLSAYHKNFHRNLMGVPASFMFE